MCFVNRRHKFRKEDDSSSAVVPQDGTPIFLFVGNNDVPFISRIDIRRCGSSPMKGNDQ